MWFSGFSFLILSLIVEVYLWWKLQASLIFLSGRTCIIGGWLNNFLPHCIYIFMSIYQSVSLSVSIYLSLFLYASLSLSLSVCLSVSRSLSTWLFLYPYFPLYVSLPIYLSASIYLSVSLSISIYPSVCLSLPLSLCVCLSLHLSTCLSLFIYFPLPLSLLVSLSISVRQKKLLKTGCKTSWGASQRKWVPQVRSCTPLTSYSCGEKAGLGLSVDRNDGLINVLSEVTACWFEKHSRTACESWRPSAGKTHLILSLFLCSLARRCQIWRFL